MWQNQTLIFFSNSNSISLPTPVRVFCWIFLKTVFRYVVSRLLHPLYLVARFRQKLLENTTAVCWLFLVHWTIPFLMGEVASMGPLIAFVVFQKNLFWWPLKITGHRYIFNFLDFTFEFLGFFGLLTYFHLDSLFLWKPV